MKQKNLTPVIVYTAKDFNPKEMQHLNQYSNTVLTKGVIPWNILLEETVLQLHIRHDELAPEKKKIIENIRMKEDILTGKNVLVVDDDVRNLFALTTVFERYKMNVITAESGKEAIAIINNVANKIDMVLMDIMMPEMDGYETTQKIRREHKNSLLPIIAVTAKAMKGDRLKCIEAGASDYITKPLKIDQLLVTYENLVLQINFTMRPKILLVDDRDDNLLSMEAILSPDEYQFIKANSGREALKILLHEFDFALILMDVNMPNLNGLETAALIYESEKLRQIPIIFITANNYGEEYIFKAYRSGAVDYIYKPINPDLLRAKVSVYIDLYRKNQMLLAQEQKLLAINKTLELEIRERKTSEEKISELNRQLLENVSHLESVNKDMDFFIYMASHDLQEPVRKLRMMMDRFCLKYQDLLDQEGHNYLGRITEVAQRMQLLIKDILSLTRISEDENPFEETNLNNMINDILIDFQQVIQEKKVDVIVEKLPIP